MTKIGSLIYLIHLIFIVAFEEMEPMNKAAVDSLRRKHTRRMEQMLD